MTFTTVSSFRIQIIDSHKLTNHHTATTKSNHFANYVHKS